MPQAVEMCPVLTKYVSAAQWESPSFQPAVTESLISAFPFSNNQMSYFRFYYLQYAGASWVA